MRDVRRGMAADVGADEKQILPYMPEPDRTCKAKDDPEISQEETGGKSMTNATMELLERVLVVQMLPEQDNVLLYQIAEALEQFRASGKPADEEKLRQAAETYIKEISRRVLEREEVEE